MGRQFLTDILLGSGNIKITVGSGTPEGVIAAPIGSFYLNSSASGGDTVAYVKGSGTGNTGWSALSVAAGSFLSASTSSTQSGYFGNILLQDDTSPSHYLTFTVAENLTSGRTLSIVTGDSDRTLTFSGDVTISGTNTGDQTITLTGDVTGSGTGSFATTIAASAVEYSMIQDVFPGAVVGNALGGPSAAQDVLVTGGLEMYAGELVRSALSGDVTASRGSSTTAIHKTAITDKTLVSAAVGDSILISDVSDSGNLKEATIQSVIDLVTVGQTRVFGVVIDGNGVVPSTGVKGYWRSPYAGTISKVTIMADVSGNAVVDLWKDVWANYPPVDADSITASAPVTLSSAIKNEDSTLSGWTTSISAGDVFGFNLDSVTTCTRIIVQIEVTTT